MGIFRTANPPSGEAEVSLAQLHRKRDAAARALIEAKMACGKAESGWQAALDSDDSKALEKAGARLAGANEFLAQLETALADYEQQIGQAEAAFASARDRATRAAKAAILDSQAAALPSMFEEYLEVSSRFAQALAEIDVFDAQGGSGLVLQTRNELEGARASIFSQLKFIADELRRDPPLPRPEQPPLPAGVRPRFMLDRNDPHEPWISTTRA